MFRLCTKLTCSISYEVEEFQQLKKLINIYHKNDMFPLYCQKISFDYFRHQTKRRNVKKSLKIKRDINLRDSGGLCSCDDCVIIGLRL